MIKSILSAEEAHRELENGFDYALIYKLSSVELLSGYEITAPDNEVTEARFFDEKRELRFFDYNGEKRWALIEDEGNEITEEKEEKFKENTLEIKEYISFDEDGQAFTEAVRLWGVK